MLNQWNRRTKRLLAIGIGKLYLFVFVMCYCGVMSDCQAFDNNNSTYDFLEQCRRDCDVKKNLMTCGKYIAIKWINNIVQEKEYEYGPFKIIKIPAIQSGRFLPEVPRMKKSNIAETMYFIREAAEDLLTRRALVYVVEQSPGAQNLARNGLLVLDDDELGYVRKSRTFEVSQGSFRIFKKKKNIILPILILLNLLKLKLLIFPIFLGVHFIKKILVLGSLLLPSILSHLKICKIAQQPFPYHQWAAASEYPVDYSSAYGHEESWDHRNDIPGNIYGNYYGHSLYNPLSYYFQNYNKQRR